MSGVDGVGGSRRKTGMTRFRLAVEEADATLLAFTTGWERGWARGAHTRRMKLVDAMDRASGVPGEKFAQNPYDTGSRAKPTCGWDGVMRG